uniref:Trimethyllysine hydroxylase, epsilon n=1 Tax=Corvus moneduloides TaxID=1196302 RepID=A0A8U7NIH9_CORMO
MAMMWCQRLAWLLRGQRGSTGRRWPWLSQDLGPVPAAPVRCCPTAPAAPRCAWQLHQDHLELRYGSTLMRLDFVWLRDHCRSASCYNAKTNQRSLDTASVDLAIRPQAVRVDETTLFLTWPDGHVTRYGLEWLVRNSYEGQKQQVMHPRILWNAEIYRQAQVPSVDCRSFLETDEGLKEFLQNFLLYGIAFVENVTPTKEDTEILAERISIIRETQGWGCSSPDSKARLTSLQDSTEDGDTLQGCSRNFGQGVSSGALPASLPPSQHGWSLQRNTSHQPPHFGHQGWEQIPELCLHSLRGGEVLFNRVLSASSLSRRAPVRGSGFCLGFPSKAAKLSRAAARDTEHSFTPSPRDTPRLLPGGKQLEEASTTHRLGLPSLPPHRPTLLPPHGVFP